ncbi:MAG: DUF4041 domain-containing protein [Pseudomonadota bacterium]
MDTNLFVLIAVGLGSSALTYGITYLLQKRKIDEYSNLQEAIKGTGQLIDSLKQERVTLHQQVETQTKRAEETILELKTHVEKKKASLDSQLRALEKVESDAAEKQINLITALRQAEESAAQKRRALITEIQQTEEALLQKKHELEEVKQRTSGLVALEARASEIAASLKTDTTKRDALREEIEALEDNLQDLKSENDLYTRIEDFVGFGIFETPEYLHEMPERYEAEIRRVRDRQRELIMNGEAVVLAEGIEINGSSKTGSAVLSGQAKLILRAFNIECDILVGKLNAGNFDRTLERIEKVAEGLEKTCVSLATGITLSYMDLKFEECRFVYEYKLKKAEKDEEQRLIREQMREEQKAIREYEKAMAEAEKEERIYRDLLEKARKKLQTAHEDEKGELEARILVLEAQLKEAEEKEERAKSMAEQTRRGHVYVISNIGSFGDEVYKIGLTRRLEPLDRIRELGDASVPFMFDVHAIIFSEDAPTLEAALHQRFNHARVNAVNRRKEFFRVSLDEIRDAALALAGDVDEIDFRTTAVADEYYETRRLQGEAHILH